MTPTSTPDQERLPRIAILGGGVGGVTAAFYLSEPGWKEHFSSITLYQQGWRLGGKGASGRGQDGRIEEHGLHIWLGFYENAFRMLHSCHEELDEYAEGGVPRWRLPFKKTEDSFQPQTEITLTDNDECGWKLWTADFFPDDDDRPWEQPDPRPPSEQPDEWSVVYYAVRCLYLAADLAWSLVRTDGSLRIVAAAAAGTRSGTTSVEETTGTMWSLLSGDVQRMLAAAAEALDAVATEALDSPLVLGAFELVIRTIDFVTDFVRRRYDELLRASDVVRRGWYVVDILIAIVRGVIEDGVLEEDNFDIIDDVDFRDWLLAHGAGRDSIDCALVRGVVYDLAFAYERGDPRCPSCGAGTALRGLLRLFFTYRGALMWKMKAGMGDVVFAPLFELLCKRGVTFEFFHRVEKVRAADGRIEEIEIDLQANVPPETQCHDYLAPASSKYKTGLRAGLAWPADPSHILKPKMPPGSPSAPGSGNARGARNTPGSPEETVSPDMYESWYAGRSAAKVGTKVLRRGAETDGFELVVFGLPISCVPHVAPDLVGQSYRWKAAVEHMRTTATQALQLWLDRPASDLGDLAEGVVLGGYVEPFDTYADMSHLERVEAVPDSKAVAYFCNVLTDPSKPPPLRGSDKVRPWLDARREVVKANAIRFLERDVRLLWPGVVHPITGKFDWNCLIAPPESSGRDRLSNQYVRANVEPSERYVLSVPGSSAHRIPPDDTGFTNLYAVGDWTSCILNAGCVEAAAISGLLAANGIHEKHGDPANIETIIGGESP